MEAPRLAIVSESPRVPDGEDVATAQPLVGHDAWAAPDTVTEDVAVPDSLLPEDDAQQDTMLTDEAEQTEAMPEEHDNVVEGQQDAGTQHTQLAFTPSNLIEHVGSNAEWLSAQAEEWTAAM